MLCEIEAPIILQHQITNTIDLIREHDESIKQNENDKLVVQAIIVIERQHNSCATTLEPREMYISSTWDKIMGQYQNYKEACNGWRVTHVPAKPPT